MASQLTIDDARQTLAAHAADKGREIFERYGPVIGWKQLLEILEDRRCVRYPCDIAFDAAPLQPGECAYPVPKGDLPEAGFTLHVHPLLLSRLHDVPLPVFYQLVLVNYGAFASAEDAELFGAAALGLPREEYYQRLCELSDSMGDGGGQRGGCVSAGCP